MIKETCHTRIALRQDEKNIQSVDPIRLQLRHFELLFLEITNI